MDGLVGIWLGLCLSNMCVPFIPIHWKCITKLFSGILRSIWYVHVPVQTSWFVGVTCWHRSRGKPWSILLVPTRFRHTWRLTSGGEVLVKDSKVAWFSCTTIEKFSWIESSSSLGWSIFHKFITLSRMVIIMYQWNPYALSNAWDALCRGLGKISRYCVPRGDKWRSSWYEDTLHKAWWRD